MTMEFLGVQNWNVNGQSLPVPSSIIVLCIHDNHKVGTDVDTPAEVARDDHDLDSPGGEQLLHHLPLQVRETLVEVAYTVAQRLYQSLEEKKNQLVGKTWKL